MGRDSLNQTGWDNFGAAAVSLLPRESKEKKRLARAAAPPLTRVVRELFNYTQKLFDLLCYAAAVKEEGEKRENWLQLRINLCPPVVRVGKRFVTTRERKNQSRNALLWRWLYSHVN